MGAGRSHLKAERLVRVEEGSGLHIELLAEGSLARLAREAVDMHSCRLMEEEESSQIAGRWVQGTTCCNCRWSHGRRELAGEVNSTRDATIIEGIRPVQRSVQGKQVKRTASSDEPA